MVRRERNRLALGIERMRCHQAKESFTEVGTWWGAQLFGNLDIKVQKDVKEWRLFLYTKQMCWSVPRIEAQSRCVTWRVDSWRKVLTFARAFKRLSSGRETMHCAQCHEKPTNRNRKLKSLPWTQGGSQGIPRGVVIATMVFKSKEYTEGELLHRMSGALEGEWKKMKSSTHFIVTSMPWCFKMSISASATEPWMPPEGARPKTAQCSIQIWPSHITGCKACVQGK